jgi:hypothetical protein
MLTEASAWMKIKTFKILFHGLQTGYPPGTANNLHTMIDSQLSGNGLADSSAGSGHKSNGSFRREL